MFESFKSKHIPKLFGRETFCLLVIDWQEQMTYWRTRKADFDFMKSVSRRHVNPTRKGATQALKQQPVQDPLKISFGIKIQKKEIQRSKQAPRSASLLSKACLVLNQTLVQRTFRVENWSMCLESCLWIFFENTQQKAYWQLKTITKLNSLDWGNMEMWRRIED